MSDQVQETNLEEDEILEDVVADQEVEVDLDDSIDEAKKASMGDPSEIPDPEAKSNSGKEAHKRWRIWLNYLGTKVGMIQAAMNHLKSMKKAEVKNMVTAMMQPQNEKDNCRVSRVRRCTNTSRNNQSVKRRY